MMIQMNENLILNAGKGNVAVNVNVKMAAMVEKIIDGLKNKRDKMEETMLAKLDCLTTYYSKVLEEEISAKQTLRIVNAQAAFVAFILTMGSPVAATITLAWLVKAVWNCKKGMKE